MKDCLPMLPDAPKGPERSPHIIEINAGTWWRFLGDPSKMAGDKPEEGFVLLLKEVRVVDGDIHTLVLGYHPTWGKGEIRFLLQDFLLDFTQEHLGEEVRQREIDSIMGRISDTGRQMAAPPSDEELAQRLLAKEKAKEAQKGADTADEVSEGCEKGEGVPLVPDALVPGGDILQAQKVAEEKIALINERKTWIEAHKKSMQQDMSLVQRFHEEKVDVSLASISSQTQYVNRMMKSVRTMRLFLGEETFHDHLVKGQGAPASEPLFFMQKMLYLDEELFVHDILDGFNGDMINDLGQVLSDNPHLVKRMLPYPRCVAITRVRRKARDFGPHKDLMEIFSNLEQESTDKMIQILVRDGENVHIIAADEDTSRAERLFPSQAEIRDIFKASRFGRESREIGVQDLEYTDRRANHDARALFYKRFLLILWGAHERLGVFGDFIPTGANWLKESLHSEHFRYIHDEEAVLEDGRKPLREFFEENRASVQPGSRVMCHWSRVFAPENTSGCYSGPDKNYRYHLEVDINETYGERIVARDGAELIVRAPINKFVRSQGEYRDSMVRVALRYRGEGTNWLRTAEGFVVLDSLKEEDLVYYIESRKARESYLAYLHLFDEALKLIRDERPKIDACIDALLAIEPMYRASDLDRALKIWRSDNRWAFPETEAQRKRILEITRLLAQPVEDLVFEDSMKPVQIRVTAKAQYEVVQPDPLSFMGRDMPQLFTHIYALSKRRGLSFKGKGPGLQTRLSGPGSFVIWEDASYDWEKVKPGHMLESDPTLAQAGAALVSMGGDLLGLLSRPAHEGDEPTEDQDLKDKMSEILKDLTVKMKNGCRGGKVVPYTTVQDLGLIFGGNWKKATGQVTSRHSYKRLVARIDLPALAARLGCFDELKAHCELLYAQPDRVYARHMRDREGKGFNVVCEDLSFGKSIVSTLNMMRHVKQDDYWMSAIDPKNHKGRDILDHLVLTSDGFGKDRDPEDVNAEKKSYSIWTSEPGKAILQKAGLETDNIEIFEV
jgi:hypothetical protein